MKFIRASSALSSFQMNTTGNHTTYSEQHKNQTSENHSICSLMLKKSMLNFTTKLVVHQYQKMSSQIPDFQHSTALLMIMIVKDNDCLFRFISQHISDVFWFLIL
jgi:hypothetical protein